LVELSSLHVDTSIMTNDHADDDISFNKLVTFIWAWALDRVSVGTPWQAEKKGSGPYNLLKGPELRGPPLRSN